MFYNPIKERTRFIWLELRNVNYLLLNILKDISLLPLGLCIYKIWLGFEQRNCRHTNGDLNCAPLVLLLLQFVCVGYMLYLSDKNQADVIGAVNSTLRYIDDLIIILLNK